MVKNKGKNLSIWIVSIVIALIIIGLVFYWLKFSMNNYNYQGANGEYKIIKSKIGNVEFYHTSVFVDEHEYIYTFRNHPEDLEDVSLEPGLIAKLNRPRGLMGIYVTQDVDLANKTDTNSVLAIASFEQVLTGDASLYKTAVVNTYTTNFEGRYLPINCNNVSNIAAVIYVKVGEQSRVYSQGDCIVIEGRGSDGIVRAGEKFAYSLLGIFR